MTALCNYIGYILPFIFLVPKEIKKPVKHTRYLAVAEINFNSTDKFATLVCKTYKIDMELALGKTLKKNISIDNPLDSQKLFSQVEDYINNHLQLKINGKDKQIDFKNLERTNEIVSVYFIINDIDDIKEFEITDTIFYELFKSQIQAVYVTVDGNRKSKEITNPENKLKFDF